MLSAAFCAVSVSAASRASVRVRADSTGCGVPFSEYNHIYKTKRVSSTYPVKIILKHGLLLVTSQRPQVLPIYRGNGVFYGLFRLNKGTNWIGGLPKGTYIINSSKVTVS